MNAYQAWSVVFGEQPSAAKWNILGTNDSSFNDGSGIGTNAIAAASLKTNAIALGYSEITTAASTSSASDTEVTGIATAVTIPAGGRDAEIVVDGSFGYGVAATNATLKVWDGAVGGTLLREFFCSFQGTVGVLTALSLKTRVSAPSVGAHTYRFSIATNGINTLQMYADGSGSKGSMTVKIV